MGRVFSFLLLSVFLSGCAGLAGTGNTYHEGSKSGAGWIYGDYFEAAGSGIEDPTLSSATQQKSLARDAAIVKAQHELLDLVKKMKLSDGRTMGLAMQNSPQLDAQVRNRVRGAEIWRTEFSFNGECRVTLRLNKNRLEELVGGLSSP